MILLVESLNGITFQVKRDQNQWNMELSDDTTLDQLNVNYFEVSILINNLVELEIPEITPSIIKPRIYIIGTDDIRDGARTRIPIGYRLSRVSFKIQNDRLIIQKEHTV